MCVEYFVKVEYSKNEVIMQRHLFSGVPVP